MTAHLLDHGLATILVVGLPLYAAIAYRHLLRLVRAGHSRALLVEYRMIIGVQWTLVALTLGIWFGSGRRATALGLTLPADARSLAGLVATGIGLALLAWQWRAVQRLTSEGEASARAQLAPVADLLPRTPREAVGFRQVAVTAGVCEEILYRGFLIWYLAAFIGPWPAAVVAGAVFGVAHFYQGLVGAAKAGGVGLLAGLLYTGTGSLLWPMVLHAALDLQGGAIARRLLASPDTPSERSEAPPQDGASPV